MTAQPEEFTLKSGEQLSHANQYGQSTEQLEAFIRSNPSRLYDQSEALLLISYNHMQLGDYANALATNEASLTIKAQLQADDLVKNYVRYGAIHLLRGNYALALSYLMRAKDLPIEDIPLYAVIDGHLAAAYRGLGQFEEAASYYRQSIETLLIEYPEDHPEIIISYYNLGQLYLEESQMDNARKYFQEGLDRAATSTDHAFLQAMLYNGMGQTYTTDPEQAARFYRQALEIANQNFGKYHRETAYASILLAETLMERQDQEAARRAILTGLQSLSPEQPALGWEIMPDSANIVIDPMLMGRALGLRAKWWLANPQTSAEALAAALSNSEQAGYWLTNALEQRIDQANRLEVLHTARQALVPGIRAGIHLWKTEGYQPALLRAFHLSEAIRQLEFRAHTTYALGFTGTFADRERQLRRSLQLAEMSFRLQPLDITSRQDVLQKRADYQEMLQEWQTYEPDTYRKRFGEPLPAATTIQEQLPPATTLLSYLTTSEDVYLFALNQDKIHSFTLHPNEEFQLADLQLKAAEFNQAIQQEDAAAFIAIAGQLYHQLVAPAADLLAASKSLIILPDGPLKDVPFEALLSERPKNDQRPFSKLHYLVQDQAVHYQYVAGNTSMASSEEAAIPHLTVLTLNTTQAEATTIAKKLKKDQYALAKATENRLRQQLQEPGFIHVSSEAFINAGLPETTGLQLAKPSITDASPGDGILHGSELLALPGVKAKLLTFDSINLDESLLQAGQAMYAPLCGSLLRAGVRSVLYPQWAEPSGTLHTLLYEAIANGQAVEEALQSTQQKMIRKKRTASPKFWAGYRLYQ